MEIHALTSFLYGVLVLVGGWVGYRKAGSRPSLISGLVSAAALFLAAGLSLAGFRFGQWLAGGTALILLTFFGYRFVQSRKFMPAGLMILASLVALTFLWTRGG